MPGREHCRGKSERERVTRKGSKFRAELQRLRAVSAHRLCCFIDKTRSVESRTRKEHEVHGRRKDMQLMRIGVFACLCVCVRAGDSPRYTRLWKPKSEGRESSNFPVSNFHQRSEDDEQRKSSQTLRSAVRVVWVPETRVCRRAPSANGFLPTQLHMGG